MIAHLKQLEVEDFKSFKGRQLIYPLLPFTSIIGSDVIGKANLLDAIGFVMGEDIEAMGITDMYELIHGADRKKPISKSATVCAVFILPDGSEFAFRRSVVSSGIEHKINGEYMSAAEYAYRLNDTINLKTKTFLLFQSSFESLCMKYPKNITLIVEEICGSNEFTEEYSRLKLGMLQAQEDLDRALSPRPAYRRSIKKKDKATQTDSDLAQAVRVFETIERKLEKRKRCRMEAEAPVQTKDVSTQTDPIGIEELVHATRRLNLNDDLDDLTPREIQIMMRHNELTKSAFERVKKMRLKLFTECFDKMCDVINGIYKAFTGDQTINAVLIPENSEEPYLGGINFCWYIPGGNYEPMSELPQIEKAIAALALLFAANYAQQSPLLVLDRLDDTINTKNVESIAKYVKYRSENIQTINFTLMEEYFNKGDLLVGIVPRSIATSEESHVSHIKVYNLDNFFGQSTSQGMN